MLEGYATRRETIADFLAQKRLALVGISRNPKDFSRGLFRELRQRGYDMVPVNPQVTEIEGLRCYARLQEVTPPLDGALVMTAPQQSEQVVHDCQDAGVTRVWLYRAAGAGAVSEAAVDFCVRNGIGLVAGFCPYMFLPQTQFFHRFHGFFLRLTGGYPAANGR